MKNSPNSITSILAATDFSKNGELAVLRGAHIAKQLGKELHLLHVIHPLDLYPELMITFDLHAKEYERLKQANGMESLDLLATTIRNDFNIVVKTAVRIGRPHAQIANYASEKETSLVVVGYRGENNILDVIMGSTAFRLLRNTPCPVLMVRNSDVTPYKEAITAVDLASGSVNVAKLACTIAPSAHVEVLHVFDLKQEVLSRDVGTSNANIKKYRDIALKHVEDELKKILIELSERRVSTKVLNGYLPEAICSRVAEVNADLVILGKKGKSSLQEFVLGSVSKSVVSMVDCDVLLA